MSDLIGDWVYADEARYLQRRLEAWRKWGTPDEELDALEKLLAAYVRVHTRPAVGMRPLFDQRAGLGLGYAISIVIERWSSRADYNFHRSRQLARQRRAFDELREIEDSLEEGP